MRDYSNGKIYKIWDINYNKCYIGSTVEQLSSRMTKHRAKYKQYVNAKYPLTNSFLSFDEFGIDNCKIELVELFPCKSKAELETREGFHIRNNECVNKNITGRTKQGYKKQCIEEHKDLLGRKKTWGL